MRFHPTTVLLSPSQQDGGSISASKITESVKNSARDTTPSPRASPQHQLAVSRELRLHLLVHLLIGDTGAPHFILVLHQNFAHFIIQAVLDRELFHHALAHPLLHRVRRFAFNQIAFDEPLDDFRSHVADIIANQEHSNSVLCPSALTRLQGKAVYWQPPESATRRRKAQRRSGRMGEQVVTSAKTLGPGTQLLLVQSLQGLRPQYRKNLAAPGTQLSQREGFANLAHAIPQE